MICRVSAKLPLQTISPSSHNSQPKLAVPEGINDWIDDGIQHCYHQRHLQDQILHFAMERFDQNFTYGLPGEGQIEA